MSTAALSSLVLWICAALGALLAALAWRSRRTPKKANAAVPDATAASKPGTTEPVVFNLSGNYFGKKRTFRFTFDFDDATTRNGFVPRLWASRKIAEMTDDIRLGSHVLPQQHQLIVFEQIG